MRTFVLRVFVPADGNGGPLCGIVEHVGTGRVERFQGSRGLIDAVLHELGRDGEDAADLHRPEVEPPAGRRSPSA